MKALIDDVKKELGNKIFSVEFVKKDGTLRAMTCRLGVTKHLQGGELKYNANAMGYLVVYDMQSKGYRTINFNTLRAIKFEGKEYNF